MEKKSRLFVIMCVGECDHQSDKNNLIIPESGAVNSASLSGQSIVYVINFRRESSEMKK